MYKIRLTDAIQIDTYLILKPEVELEFDEYSTTTEIAADTTLQALEEVVRTQLDQLAQRVVKSPDKVKSILANVSVDPRFKQLIRKYK